MFIFGLYTVMVWWIAFRHRRRWLGLVAVVVGVAGMYLVSELLARLFPTADGRGSPMVAVLLIPYLGMLLVGGLYIVALPGPKRVMTCRGCGYDMRGLDEGSRCPECGREDAAVMPARSSRGGLAAAKESAAPDSPEDTQGEDAQGHPGEQGPHETSATAA